ncbi:MAG: hypothetical protein IJK31_10970 [Ruminococcus sp.]|nr:hypothetical protein [Ruminococcus sp.]
MKDKIYVTPEMEIIEFDEEDIILTSGGGMKGNSGAAGDKENQGYFDDLFNL